jgi:hypothetical protein
MEEIEIDFSNETQRTDNTIKVDRLVGKIGEEVEGLGLEVRMHLLE